ncbi:hypothetical protein KFK09_013824 [Dendrobium nobile]|uniref:anthranilate synthase n=1 Tax=Dendrobium nobile TaxID=94219 RepID=A0A8T3BB98_DENNO|nr:hypothetical protein KFK09_013824 [Dendrobium nobile]
MAAAASSLLSFSKVPRLTALPRRLSSQGTWKVRFGIDTVRANASFGRARVSAEEKKDVRPIIVIDNYDSFTKNPKGILISPGPGAPQDSGISLQTVVELGPSIPLFGVCMGLQCIGEAFGGKIVRSPSGVRHGKSSLVYYDEKLGEILFDGLSNPFSACRYHSLIIEKETFPSDKLEITAWTEDGLIMAARHKKYKHIKGVQFHPESIITPDGKMMILNFIKFLDKFHL